jgi:hypothetical protein
MNFRIVMLLTICIMTSAIQATKKIEVTKIAHDNKRDHRTSILKVVIKNGKIVSQEYHKTALENTSTAVLRELARERNKEN